MSKIVEEYWSGVARRLQEEVNTFNRLIGHSGEQGKENELSLVRLMENLLPSAIGTGSGMIIDSTGNYSRQMDIIIYDAANQPTIMAQTNQTIFPIESVLLAIEVKTTLTEDELEDCIEKSESIKRLQPCGDRECPPLLVLAYHAEGTPPTVAKHVRKHDNARLPELICVVEPGIMAGNAVLLDPAAEQGYSIGVVGLHSTSDSEDRIPGEWQKPTASERARVLRKGSTFPVARLSGKQEDRIVGEPGRALLIFCAAIMDILSSTRTVPTSILRHYLQFPAREMAELPQPS
ncbi:DUF6602 domain-containing protein [Streptomyces ovatisporus]|uniref:DUF6602 domain-containing protein n=1 Tax=Streptomyces ovatisporus TaxID=1128682 RepID=A0ABV9A7K8_9ACTN